MSNNSNFTIRNATKQRLVLKGSMANHGVWGVSPPASIDVGATTRSSLSITSSNNGPTSGYVIYEAESGPVPRPTIEFSVICSPAESAGKVKVANTTFKNSVIYTSRKPLHVAFNLTG